MSRMFSFFRSRSAAGSVLGICLLLAGIFTGDACLPASAGAAGETMWVLDYKHFGTGSYRVLLAKNAVKLVNLTSGTVTISRAPEWKISCTNPADKLEWRGSLDYFSPASLSNISKMPFNRSKDKESGRERVRGLTCKVYVSAEGNHTWLPEDFKTAPQVGHLVCRYFNMPLTDVVPVRFLKARALDNMNVRAVNKAKFEKEMPWMGFERPCNQLAGKYGLDLTKCSQVPFRESEFQYPKGMKQTKSLKEVLISNQQKKDFADLVDALAH
ncbi:MAG: hypothetical protein K2Y32_05035 [Candidatus Obscuribacterales bacterium]|nr:hypothetical protein [Candidatus Obscuribacterales bacterium]